MQKMRIRAADSNQTLMRIIKNPVTAHLPTGAPIYGTHMKGELVDPLELAASLPNGPVCFVFGAMSKGFISGEDCEKLYSFSQYPVRGARACAVAHWKHTFTPSSAAVGIRRTQPPHAGLRAQVGHLVKKWQGFVLLGV